MPNFYQAKVTSFTDAELYILEQELLDAGVGMLDEDDHGESSWEGQALYRLGEISNERDRRRELADPKWAEERRRMRSMFAPIHASKRIPLDTERTRAILKS
jgi:hypothetical protein